MGRNDLNGYEQKLLEIADGLLHRQKVTSIEEAVQHATAQVFPAVTRDFVTAKFTEILYREHRNTGWITPDLLGDALEHELHHQYRYPESSAA